MKISVIFTTYNSVDWLEKVLWGFYFQSFKDFELIVADDGSSIETQICINKFSQQTGMPVKHIWQEDHGFQKTKILNKALAACSCDYVVFTDGDCIPRADFLTVHYRQKQKGKFLSGGYFKLPLQTSLAITKTEIETGLAFQSHWLKQHGLKSSHKTMKLTAKGLQQQILNYITPARATWNGHNASGWRDDLLAVNGFDERMQYGGEDREFGERLMNAGITAKQIRYSAICLHLYHDHHYVQAQMISANLVIRQATKQHKYTKTAFGIVKA